MNVQVNKKNWRFLPLSAIIILYMCLLLLISGETGHAPCTTDGVGMAYVAYGIGTLWYGGTVPILLISAAVLFYFKYQPEWEFYLWSILLVPAGLLSIFLFRLFYCHDWQKISDELIMLITGGASAFFFSSIIAAIACFGGMYWSKKRR